MTGECDCCGFRVRLRIVQPDGRCLCRVCNRPTVSNGSGLPPLTSTDFDEASKAVDRLLASLRAKIEAPPRLPWPRLDVNKPHLVWEPTE